jgi:hypothetical protein
LGFRLPGHQAVPLGVGFSRSTLFFVLAPVGCDTVGEEIKMALFDDILSGGDWMTDLAIGVSASVILPLAADSDDVTR